MKTFLALLGMLPGLILADNLTDITGEAVSQGMTSTLATLTSEEQARIATPTRITFGAKSIPPDPELTNLALRVRERIQLTAQEQNWLETKPSVHVRVGDYPPFHFVADGIPQGLGIDYMHTICLVYSLNCDYVPGLNVAQSMRSMTEPDGIAVQIAWQRNAERERVAIFTRPYVSSPFVIFQRKGSEPILSMQDLAGRQVVVEKDYVIHQLLKSRFPDLQLIEVDFSTTALTQLASGQVDAYVSSLMAGHYLSQKLGLSNIVVAAPTPFEPNRLEIAVRNDWPVLAALIDKAQTAITEEEHRSLRNRWLNIRIMGFFSTEQVLLYGSLVTATIVLLLLVGALLTIRRMRREIKARYDAEHQLQINESRLREAMEGTETGLWEWNPQTGEVYLDPVWFTMLGYAPDAMPHAFETFEKLVHPDDHTAALKMIETILAEQREWFDIEFRLRGSDGRYRWINSKGRLLAKDSDENPSRFIGIHTDISQRKQAEEALRESEQRFRRLVEQSPVSIQIHGLDGKLIQCNAAYARLYALSEVILEELYEKYNVLQDEQARTLGVMPYIERAYRGEDVVFPPYQYDGIDTLKTLDFNHPVSRKCWVQTLGFPLKDEHGRITSVVFMSEDFSERKQAEQAILEYQRRLKDLAAQLARTEERERRSIATELHDNVGQSLAVMRMLLAAAKKQTVGRQVDVMLNEVSDSLRVAIQDTRSIISELTSPILHELGLSAALAEWLREQIGERYGLETRFSDDGEPKPMSEDIQALLYRSVRELLMNVVKHANANQISVYLERVDDNVRIVVEDDGIGLVDGKIPQQKPGEGGFGLFSIEERIYDIGGSLALESLSGQGVRATLTAPLEND